MQPPRGAWRVLSELMAKMNCSSLESKVIFDLFVNKVINHCIIFDYSSLSCSILAMDFSITTLRGDLARTNTFPR